MLCETLVHLGEVYEVKGEHIKAGDVFENAAKRYFEQELHEKGCYALLQKV